MFCPKCGKQLPDGAAFCASCGTPLNVQPAAPSEPVIPAAPVVPEQPVVSEQVVMPEQYTMPEQETTPVVPVMNEAPVVNEAPVMNGAPVINETPVMNGAPVMNGQFNPSQYPAGAPVNNMPAPKKSKAPLFIILGVSALILIIVAIILVIVLTGGDDDDKKPVSGKDNQTTTETSSREDESTTEEETTTKKPAKVNIDDAEDIVKDFMKAFEKLNYSKATKNILPSLVEAYEDMDDDISEVLQFTALYFSDADGNMLDYSIKSVKEDDSEYFDDYYKYDLKDYNSYVEPEAFAKATIEFTDGSQSGNAYIYLAYCDGKFYIYEFDTDELDFEVETSGNEPETDDYVSTFPEGDISSLLTGSNIYYNGEPSGSRNNFGGFSMVMPNGYVENSSTLWASANSSTSISVQVDPSLSTAGDMATYITASKTELESVGYVVGDMGYVYLNNYSGYYMEYTAGAASGILFIVEKNGSAYLIAIATIDPESNEYDDALFSAASLLID